LESPEHMQDPLLHLPCCPAILDFKKGQIVYAQEEPADSVYLILQGMVKTAQATREGRQVVIDIYHSEEFFGESALLNRPDRHDQATAMDDTRVMVWSAREFNEIVMTRPVLAMAMLQTLVERLTAFSQRVESLAQDNVLERLGRSLIRFSRRMGRPAAEGAVRMPPLAHTLLAQYVGTSREIVTHYMTEFRTRGFLTYSRKEILIHGAELERWLAAELPATDPAELDAGAEPLTVRQLLACSKINAKGPERRNPSAGGHGSQPGE